MLLNGDVWWCQYHGNVIYGYYLMSPSGAGLLTAAAAAATALQDLRNISNTTYPSRWERTPQFVMVKAYNILKSLSSNLAFILGFHKSFFINKQQTQDSLKVTTVRYGQSLQHFKSLSSNLAFILGFHKTFFINKRNFHKRSIH